MSSRGGSAGEKAPGSSCGTLPSISPASWGLGVLAADLRGLKAVDPDDLERETAPEYAAAARAIALSGPGSGAYGVRE